MAASGLTVASLRRRAAAGAIDATLIVLVIAGVTGLIVWRRSRRDEDQPLSLPWLARLGNLRALNRGISLATAIAGRNARSPGRRIVGVRAVDARTGALVSIRSAAIRHALTSSWGAVSRSLLPSAKARAKGEVNGLGCAPPLLVLLVPIYLPAVRSPANQTLPDRFAGIVVVKD